MIAQVVPTQYKTLYGELSYLNQYSVIEKDVPVEQMQRVEPIQGLHLRDFQGIIFTYDFHPVGNAESCLTFSLMRRHCPVPEVCSGVVVHSTSGGICPVFFCLISYLGLIAYPGY